MKATILFILAIVALSSATTYYISLDGDDSNDGKSLDKPWKTLGMVRFVSGGDTVYVRGGTYVDGALYGCATPDQFDKPILIQNYNGEKVTLTGHPETAMFFYLSHCSYIVDGFNFENMAEGLLHMMFLEYVQNTIIQNCNFSVNPSNNNLLIRASTNVTVTSCNFDHAGKPASAGIPYPPEADASNIYIEGSNHVLIEDNHFQYGGHGACDIIDWNGFNSTHIIVRKNKVESHWGGGIYASRYSRYVLIEDNILYYAGEESGYPKTGILLSIENPIVRRNVIARTGDDVPNADYCMSLYAFPFYGMIQNINHARVYNNLMYKCGGAAIGFNQKDQALQEDTVLMNNIVYRNRVGGDFDPNWPAGNYAVTFDTYHANIENRWGDQNFALGHIKMQNNLLLFANTTDLPDEPIIYWIETTNHVWNLSAVQSQYPNVFSGNVNFNPGMVDPDNENYKLKADSKSIDAGAFLTKTTSAGTSTKTINVEDPYFFMDGWGMVQGDSIVVGSNSPVTVTDVDYDNKILTVDSQISYQSGDKVSLRFEGNAPDLGPFEYSKETKSVNSGARSLVSSFIMIFIAFYCAI